MPRMRRQEGIMLDQLKQGLRLWRQAGCGLLVGIVSACALEVDAPASAGLSASALTTSIARDAHFGKQGAVFLTPGAEESGFANALAIQAGQSVIAGRAGVIGGTTPSSFLVARFASDGSLDPGFGSGGKVTGLFPSANSEATALAIQADGSMIVAGHALGANQAHCYTVVRLTATGSVDRNFGSFGSVQKCFASDGGQVHALALQRDGKIVLAGFARASDLDSLRAGVVRLTSSGTFDTSFDADGVAQLGTAGLVARAIGLQSDGKIIVAGVANDQFAIERYAADGSFDRTFAADGVRLVSFVSPPGTTHSPNHPLSSEAFSLSIDGQDRILVAGRAYTHEDGRDYHFGALARLTASGELDDSFADGGLLLSRVGSAFGRFAAFDAVSAHSNGALVVAGEYESAAGSFQLALAQYDPAGALQAQVLDTFAPAGLVLRPHALLLGRGAALLDQYATIAGDGSASISTGGRRNGAGLMRYVLSTQLRLPTPSLPQLGLPTPTTLSNPAR
jgi:uncharacterized delta-60 repeat protein